MKFKKSLSLVAGLFIALLILFYACKGKTSDLKNDISVASSSMDGSGEVYLVDTIASIIEWVGATPGDYKHSGTIKLSDGQFTVKDNQLTSGKFTININSINNIDQAGKDKTNLESHLKNQDFFEVEKFPFGGFEITEIKKDSAGQKVIGNLTLKQVTNSIQIPTTIKVDEKFVLAETATFTIDRTKWGIVYNSGIIGTIKDDLINDEITLKLKIVAVKVIPKNL
jgi:polyisoprenoid-binding protein YceI